MIPAPTARLIPPVLLLGLVAAVIGGTDRFPGSDGPHVLAQALHLGRMVQAGEISGAVGLWVHLAAPQPPVGYLPPVLLAALGFPLRAVIVGSDLIALGLLLDGIRRLAGPVPWWSPTLAWALATATGLLWWSADHYGFDLVAAATITQALGWLAASEGLSRPGPRRAFALWLALAFLSKYTAPMFLVAPVLWICVPAIWRRPRALLEAVGIWALVALPYYLLNHELIGHYVASTFAPPELPGNLPPELGLRDRLGGGQAFMLAGLVEGAGLPLLALLLAGALRERRAIPLLGAVGGLVVVGMVSVQQGRYMLPAIFLLAAAAAPRSRPAWPEGLVVALLGLTTLRGSATQFSEVRAAEAPANRAMAHDVGALLSVGSWPAPAQAFQPISEAIGPWKLAEVVAAIHDQLPPGGAVVLAMDTLPEAPSAAAYMLVAEAAGTPFDLLALHTRMGPLGLEVNGYLGPFPTRMVPEQRPWEGMDLVYAVRATAGRGAVSTWLDSVITEPIARWSLPGGHEGMLLRLVGTR